MPRQAGQESVLTAGQQHGVIELEVRREIARELHDRVAQTLTGMLVDVENFKSQEVEWEDVIRKLDTVQSSTREVLASIRQLLADLRGEPEEVEDFVDSLRAMATRFTEATQIGVELAVRPGWPALLNPRASLNLYRIVEEALANIRMHSRAQSVRILLEPVSEAELGMVIDDDGRGLDLDPARPLGFGIVGMRERALFLGGSLKIESIDGQGTAILANFPRAAVVREAADRARSKLIMVENLTA